MERQLSFAQSEYARKQKTTRRDRFLAEMEAVMPWARLMVLIAPHYPKGRRGRPPLGVERMLRAYFLHQWFGLADEALEAVNARLTERVLLLRAGTLVDATIIAAPKFDQ